jgi:hypothetical protein
MYKESQGPFEFCFLAVSDWKNAMVLHETDLTPLQRMYTGRVAMNITRPITAVETMARDVSFRLWHSITNLLRRTNDEPDNGGQSTMKRSFRGPLRTDLVIALCSLRR